MEIKLNGKPQTVDGAATVGQLLGQLGIEMRNLAVEHNGDFLDESDLAQATLKDGDTLEIVRFVGGG